MVDIRLGRADLDTGMRQGSGIRGPDRVPIWNGQPKSSGSLGADGFGGFHFAELLVMVVSGHSVWANMGPSAHRDRYMRQAKMGEDLFMQALNKLKPVPNHVCPPLLTLHRYLSGLR